jgi:hypothetical protein
MQSQTMKMYKSTILMTVASLVLLAGEVQAQATFAAEGRVGVTLPTGDLSDAGAESGIGLGAELQVNFTSTLTAYLGLYRYAFGCANDCDFDDDPTSTGLGAGVKYIFHNPGDVLVWGRGGIVVNRLSANSANSDRELGFELGAGADLPIATQFYLVPNIAFVSHAVGNGGFKANFFTLGLGLHYHFQ